MPPQKRKMKDCPECGCKLNPKNYEKHLSKVHAIDSQKQDENEKGKLTRAEMRKLEAEQRNRKIKIVVTITLIVVIGIGIYFVLLPDDVNVDDILQIGGEDEGPIANAGLDQTVAVGELISFSGTGSGSSGSFIKYEWDFDSDGIYDDTCEACGNIQHAYNEVGIYTATFRITDSNGATGTDTRIITVTE